MTHWIGKEILKAVCNGMEGYRKSYDYILRFVEEWAGRHTVFAATLRANAVAFLAAAERGGLGDGGPRQSAPGRRRVFAEHPLHDLRGRACRVRRVRWREPMQSIGRAAVAGAAPSATSGQGRGGRFAPQGHGGGCASR